MMKKIVMVMLLPTTLVANAYAGTVSDSLQTTLYYRSGYSLLELSYMDNAAKLETLKQGIRGIGDNPNTVLQHIKILSAASPEGNSKLNKRLARRRGERLRDYLREMLNLPDSVFTVSSAGEDWEGLALKIQKENAPWSRKALYIIRNTPEWIVRNGKVVDGKGKIWKISRAAYNDFKYEVYWFWDMQHNNKYPGGNEIFGTKVQLYGNDSWYWTIADQIGNNVNKFIMRGHPNYIQDFIGRDEYFNNIWASQRSVNGSCFVRYELIYRGIYLDEFLE